MHQLFVSEGVVLGKRGMGEANTRVAILTKELGLVTAAAKSARVERSKLRYGLEPLTIGTFSLIQGKYEWKLTGVDKASRTLMQADFPHRQAMGRITKLLLRLVRGEEPTPALFDTTLRGLELLASSSSEEVDAVEIVLVLRILSHLGYLPHTPTLAQFVEEEFSLELSAKALVSRGLLIKTINESLHSTGL